MIFKNKKVLIKLKICLIKFKKIIKFQKKLLHKIIQIKLDKSKIKKILKIKIKL